MSSCRWVPVHQLLACQKSLVSCAAHILPFCDCTLQTPAFACSVTYSLPRHLYIADHHITSDCLIYYPHVMSGPDSLMRGLMRGRAYQQVVQASGACVQDYRVHIKHTDGHFEHVPYFSLPANDLTDVIAPSCYSCFDYPNALADLVGHSCSTNLPLSLVAQISRRMSCMNYSRFKAAHFIYSYFTRLMAQASQCCVIISSHASHGFCHLTLRICQCGLCQFEVQAST